MAQICSLQADLWVRVGRQERWNTVAGSNSSGDCNAGRRRVTAEPLAGPGVLLRRPQLIFAVCTNLNTITILYPIMTDPHFPKVAALSEKSSDEAINYIPSEPSVVLNKTAVYV